MDIRTLPNIKCSCGGRIGYYEGTEEFKCILCGKTYSTEEEHKTPEAQILYSQSEKGKAQQEAWRHSQEGLEHLRRYDQSPKGKLAKRKYYYGPKGQAAHKRHKVKVDKFKNLKKWLDNHPGKTIEDFIEETQNGPTT